MVEKSQLRELSHETLVQLVADVWEIDGWSTHITDPGEKFELEIYDQELEFTVPSGDTAINIIATQSVPCFRIEYIHIRQGGPDEVVGNNDLRDFNSAVNAQHTPTGTFVTTGTVEETIWNTRVGRGLQIIDGAMLCDVIEEYTDRGLDYDHYFEQ